MQRRIKDIRNELEGRYARSAWDRGVKDFAVDMFDNYIERREIGKKDFFYDDTVRIGKITEADLLNGAKNWSQYSHGGCALIYDSDICEALCNQSEKRKTRGGKLPPNDSEGWLDVQARALKQAALIVIEAVNRREATA